MIDIISFFHLTGLTGMNIISVFMLLCVFAVVAIIWCLWRYKVIQKWRASHLSILSFLPGFLGKRYIKETLLNQKFDAFEGIQYTDIKLTQEQKKAAFMDFLIDLPVFMIDDGFFSRKIRSILESGGARFQQVVLHDSSDIDDVFVWIRKEGHYFIHDKGVYLWPWDNQKSIQHWDIQDMRPLVDKSKDAQWQNPLMNSRYFWGILNSRSMEKRDNALDSGVKLLMILIVISILVAGYGVYQGYNNQKELVIILSKIANNTVRP